MIIITTKNWYWYLVSEIIFYLLFKASISNRMEDYYYYLGLEDLTVF